MAKVNYSDLAKRDLAEIWLYIANDSPKNARSFIEYIENKCLMLAQLPRIGREYPELANGLFGFPIKNYMVFYNIADDGIVIARVLNAKRDIPALFD
ncbi:MAG: type II toxin-antitoxin system RelE/ParE family toxin [Deltaproteobacteria bacterium]|nr:type II toxin-antitoxin system RelE/ParE family toxin [Deltaproteobacteria bacterium]